MPLGIYRVVLTVDGKDYEKPLRIEGDPTLPPDVAAMQGMQGGGGGEEDDEAEEEEEEREEAGLIRDGQDF